MAIDEEDKPRLRALSEREYEILARFAHGQSCAYIVVRMGIAPTTVTAIAPVSWTSST
jgi:DNA-binding CsgD family transcriptional regulator